MTSEQQYRALRRQRAIEKIKACHSTSGKRFWAREAAYENQLWNTSNVELKDLLNRFYSECRRNNLSLT